MTDSEKLLAVAGFMTTEGVAVEDSYRILLSRRTVKWRECDTLDFLELIQYRDRWEYYAELDIALGNIIFDRHDRRPRWYPLR